MRVAILAAIFLIGCRNPASPGVQTGQTVPTKNSGEYAVIGEDVFPVESKKVFLRPGKYKDISNISKLENLTHLKMNFNPIRDITPLRHLKKLEELGLSGTMVTDLQPLSDLPHLHTVELFKLSDYGSINLDNLPPSLRLLRVSKDFPIEKLRAFKRKRHECKIEIYDHTGTVDEFRL